MIVFTASSTFVLRYFSWLLGTINKKPEVGFGVVGTNTLTNSPFILLETAPLTSPVVKPKTQSPFLGYSSNTTSLNALELFLKIVSIICLVVL